MQQTIRKSRWRHPRRCAGFNMMEVLVAIGIFALGFTAVAAVFPTAAMMQRNSADDIESRNVERNVKAMIRASGITAADLNTIFGGQPADFQPFPTVNNQWPLDVRSHPAAITSTTDRSFYWLPLARFAPAPASQWQISVFVMRRRDGAIYGDKTYTTADNSIPGLRNVAVTKVGPSTLEISEAAPNDYIEVGVNDFLITNNGVIYNVESVQTDAGTPQVTVRSSVVGNPTELWYAVPDNVGDADPDEHDNDDQSPAMRAFIITL